MAAPTPGITFTPPPHEQGYYDALFQTADVNRTGALGGQEAVLFFLKSKLPQDFLRDVWARADQPISNNLDKRKFSIAVRLIQLRQNGQGVQGPDLAVPDGVVLRPAFFEGVSGVSVPLPPPPNQQGQQQQQTATPRGPTPQPMSPAGHMGGRPPPSPGGSNMTPQSSNALTVQDPYMITASEQARYEELFPQYAKPDGFLYGQEAWELFCKSGVPQDQLGAILRMADSPLDSRLDKLEFVLAMHLIICVSKKNLPVPPGLPPSLQQLKSQQLSQTTSPPRPPQQQPPIPQPPPRNTPTPVMQQQQAPAPQLAQRNAPTPVMQQQHQQLPPPSPQPHQQQMPPSMPSPQQQHPPQPIIAPGGGAPMIPSPSRSMPPPQPPSLQQPQMGGLSGLPGPPPLAPVGGGDISDAFAGLDNVGGGPQDMKSYLASSTPIATSSSFDTAHSTSHLQPPPQMMRSTLPEESLPQPKARQPAAVQVEDVSESHFNDNGDDVVQKKAVTAKTMSRDSSAELEKWKAMAQKLQAEKVSLQAQLVGGKEEEDSLHRELLAVQQDIEELMSELTTLRAQVQANKARILQSTAELKAAEDKRSVIQNLVIETRSTKQVLEEATEGVERSAELMSKAGSVVPSTRSFDGDLFAFDSPPAGTGALLTEASNLAPAANGFPPKSAPQPETVTSQDSDLPAPAPPLPQIQENIQQQDVPAVDMFGLQQQAPPSMPTHKPKQESYGGFDGDFVMGGTSGPSFAAMAAGANAPAPASNFIPPITSVMSAEEIDSLKSKSREADSVARDAEDSKRQLVANMDELRRVADEAEKKLREFNKEHDGKKKGRFARGKKKDAKEAEKLAQDAKTKKEAFLQAQSQVNDANSLAEATRKEADQLRKEVEDAEMEAATAASMADSAKPTAAPPAPKPSAYPPINGGFPVPTNGGFPAPGGTGFPTQHAYGMPPLGAAQAPGGFGSMENGGMGFNPSVMGSGGGIDIPTPSGDPYENPFAS